MRMLKIGSAILGAFGGFFMGGALYTLAFFYANSFILLMVLSIASAVICAFFSFKYYDKIVIFGTSFIGSYSIIRAFSLIFGKYPGEI